MHSPQRRCRPTPAPAQSWKRSSAACTARTSTVIPAVGTRWSIPIAACRATGIGGKQPVATPRVRPVCIAARTAKRAPSSSRSALPARAPLPRSQLRASAPRPRLRLRARALPFPCLHPARAPPQMAHPRATSSLARTIRPRALLAATIRLHLPRRATSSLARTAQPRALLAAPR